MQDRKECQNCKECHKTVAKQSTTFQTGGRTATLVVYYRHRFSTDTIIYKLIRKVCVKIKKKK